MYKEFKFLEGQTGYIFLSNDIASWVWDYLLPYTEFYNQSNHYVLETGQFNGIIEFLQQFPPNYIAVVCRITHLETMSIHDRDNQGIPWGFNIQTDLIEITYFRFLELDNLEEII
jgi:hypothetical protein